MKKRYEQPIPTRHVTSLEQSRRLKKLGVKQESAYYWYYLEAEGVQRGSTPTLVDRQYRDEAVVGKYEWDYAFISAITVAELGEMLPQFHSSISKNMYTGEKYLCEFWKDGRRQHYTWSETEADARALMLIHLLENKLITL